MKIALCITALLLSATIAFAAEKNGVLGIWTTEMNESKVEIYTCGEKICGKIVWLKDPLYTDSKYGEVGTPWIDKNNPDPALKKRPILNLQILEGFKFEGGNTWGGGTCYDPKSGNTYRGKLYLTAPNRLELRGYIGIPLFGRTSVWTR